MNAVPTKEDQALTLNCVSRWIALRGQDHPDTADPGLPTGHWLAWCTSCTQFTMTDRPRMDLSRAELLKLAALHERLIHPTGTAKAVWSSEARQKERTAQDPYKAGPPSR